MLLNFVILVNESPPRFFSDSVFPLGEYGFLLPEDQIVPSGQETLAGEVALLKYIEGQVYA